MEFLSREDLKENIVVIKINKSYRKDMSALELYDITRGCWKRKIESVEKADYAFSVVSGEVVEVYSIDRWVPASQSERVTSPYNPETEEGRIAFFGEVAGEDIRSKYIGKSVAKLFKHGEADPVKLFLKDAVGINLPDSINIEASPLLIIQTEDEPIIVCPRCEYSFTKAPRCPECGQLIKYGKERWNKPNLGSLEEWEKAAFIQGVRPEDVTAFIRRICEKEGFSYHIGAVDMSLDMTTKSDMKSLQVLMLFGKGGCCAFQPKEIINYMSRYDLPRDIAEWYMEEMRQYLSPDQKNTPYERENGYYYIDFSTLIDRQDEFIRMYEEFLQKTRNAKL